MGRAIGQSVFGCLPARLTGLFFSEVGWGKWTPKSDKIDRRRCQHEEGPARKVHEGVLPGSSEAGNGREAVHARGRATVVLAAIDIGVLGKVYKAGNLGDVGKTYRPLTDVEMELARTKKELAEVKMERDILKKQPRTLPRSRCPVRDDEGTAARVPRVCPEPDVGRIG